MSKVKQNRKILHKTKQVPSSPSSIALLPLPIDISFRTHTCQSFISLSFPYAVLTQVDLDYIMHACKKTAKNMIYLRADRIRIQLYLQLVLRMEKKGLKARPSHTHHTHNIFFMYYDHAFNNLENNEIDLTTR